MKMKDVPAEFLQRLPKADLHVHLDGSLRLSTLIELAQKEGVELPSYTEKGMRRLVYKDKYSSLVEYLKGFSYTGAVMQNAENIEELKQLPKAILNHTRNAGVGLYALNLAIIMGTLGFGLPAGLNKLLRTKVTEDKKKINNSLLTYDRLFDLHRNFSGFRLLKHNE